MTNTVSPIIGLTKWLVFWLKAYICMTGFSICLDLWTHFSPEPFADSHVLHGTVSLLMYDANAAPGESPEAEENDAFAGNDDRANEDLDLDVRLTLWDMIDLAATLAVSFLLIGLYLLTGLLFLTWVYRMAANLRVLQRDQFPYTPLWSVCCFFVPFANVVVPPRIMQKIWSTVSGSNAKSLVPGWWMLVIVQWLLGQVDARMLMGANRRGQGLQFVFSHTSFLMGLATQLVSAIVALFTLLLIRQITREYDRHLDARLAQASG